MIINTAGRKIVFIDTCCFFLKKSIKATVANTITKPVLLPESNAEENTIAQKGSCNFIGVLRFSIA